MTGQFTRLCRLIAIVCVVTSSASTVFAEEVDELEKSVARMASTGASYGASLSPDGTRMSYLSNATGMPEVWIANIDGSNPVHFSKFEDQVSGASWSPAGDVIAVQVAPGGGLNTQIYLLPLAGGEPKLITAGGDVNNWLTGWSDDGRFVTYSSNADGPGGMDCYRYDTAENSSQLIALNNGIGQCLLSPDNHRAIALRMVSRGNTDLYLIDLESGQEQLLTPHVGVALSGQPKFLNDHSVLLVSNVDREMSSLAQIDIDAQGQAGELTWLAARDDAELSSFEILEDARLVLLWNAAGRSELGYLNLGNHELLPGPELPTDLARGMDASKDGSQLLLTLSGASALTNVWHLNTRSQEFTMLTNSAHEGIDMGTLVRPELRSYPAHDGLMLSGWLYRPHGADGPTPMVLSFHGGPEGQARPSFRATYQALLSQGIAVFAPNVRGSSGFGKTFVNLDNGALRFDGVKDIESTVRFVVDQGLANAQQVGIMGGSYGGYMVMAGLTEYPELFRAGANLFGVVNFATFFANTEPWMAAISTVEYGDPVKDKELLEQLSPIHKLDRVKAPTLVLHGANDTNVPVVEAEQVVDTLKARGVPVKYVLFPDEGHGWRKTKNRITSDVEIVRWFVSNLSSPPGEG